jgi:hypothetical protein
VSERLTPRTAVPARLRGRIDALDGQGGGRIHVVEPEPGFRHFTRADWHAGGQPVLGLTVSFRPATGGARDVRP